MRRLIIMFVLYLVLFGLLILFTSCTNENNPQQSATMINSTASSTPSGAQTLGPMNTRVSSPSSSPTTTNAPIPSATLTVPIPSVTLTVLTQTASSTPTSMKAANQIRAMLIDKNGDLWTGGPGGIVHWDIKTGRYVIYTTHNSLASNKITAIAQTLDGSLWFGSFGAGLFRFDGVSWQTYTTYNGLPGDYIVSLATTPDGELWLDVVTTPYIAEPGYSGHFGKYDGTSWYPAIGGGFDRVIAALDGTLWGRYYMQGLWQFDGQKWNHISDITLEDITALAVASDGVVWAATAPPTKVYRVDHGLLLKLDIPWIDQNEPRITAIGVTLNNTAWFGFSYTAPSLLDKCGMRNRFVEELGVYRYNGDSWLHFTKEDGLVDNKICTIVVDKDGNVWFGAFDDGVSRFDGQTWTTYAVP